LAGAVLRKNIYVIACVAVVALSVASLFVGVANISLIDFLDGRVSQTDWLVLQTSRIPRTLALVFAGTSMAVAGAIMQMLARNKFVEPATTGTVEAAALGMLVVLLFAPDLPIVGKMLMAGVFALAGTGLFLWLLTKIPLRSVVIVPLIGMMLGGVISSFAAFIAYRFDMMQAMNVWTSGDFSTVLRGRYEVLWLAFGLAIIAYRGADKLTMAGLGQEFSVSLGLDYRKVMTFGLVIISLVTASVVVSAGMIPFVGLIVPNLVSLAFGDNLKKTLPWIALLGAAIVLVCDIIGRLIIAPFEVPVGAVLGVIGSLFFLYLVLGRNAYAR